MDKEAVFSKINAKLKEKDTPVIIAIDGMCAAGKSTLARELQQYYEQEKIAVNVFHMDDFFLRKEQRTKERMEETGGNVDYERFFEEVIKPLKDNKKGKYRPYDCTTGEVAEGTFFESRRLNIIEGSYSRHPYFKEVYDIKIFMETQPDEQIRRIKKRNGEVMLSRFLNEWIPKENAYFDAFSIKKESLVITT